jgi:hypothetical protein
MKSPQRFQSVAQVRPELHIKMFTGGIRGLCIYGERSSEESHASQFSPRRPAWENDHRLKIKENGVYTLSSQ